MLPGVGDRYQNANELASLQTCLRVLEPKLDWSSSRTFTEAITHSGHGPHEPMSEPLTALTSHSRQSVSREGMDWKGRGDN